MYYTYILHSLKHGRFYIGSASDLAKRLKRHNAGGNRSTKSGVPWKVVYQECFTTKQDAYKREMQIKRYKGGNAFKKLVKN